MNAADKIFARSAPEIGDCLPDQRTEKEMLAEMVENTREQLRREEIRIRRAETLDQHSSVAEERT